MGNEEKALTPSNPRVQRKKAHAALWYKEWRTQRWRFFLGTIVLSGLLAGMLRAQIIPNNEAALLIYWPVGVLMTIFLAMGPVASEKADRTWEFLVAQPVSRADALYVKWAVGVVQLIGMMAIATGCGILAMWSRGFSGQATVFAFIEKGRWPEFNRIVVEWITGHPAAGLCLVAVPSVVALACWYTPLFFILTRARNEFAAALGGILLTIALHAWLVQIWLAEPVEEHPILAISALLNPLLTLVIAVTPGLPKWLLLGMPLYIVLWILVPLFLVRRFAERVGRS